MSAKDKVPELVADSEANCAEFVMMLHVIHLHVFKVATLRTAMVHEVMHFIVYLVTNQPAHPYSIKHA